MISSVSLQLPDTLRGQIELPSSKSLSARVLVLADGLPDCRLTGLSDCDDTCALRAALQQSEGIVDIGAAGTAMRFATAVFATTEGTDVLLTGTERMQQRPIRILVDALRQMGADIRYTAHEGFPPLAIRGRTLRGGTVVLPADVSSQYISALLLVGHRLEDGLTLRLQGTIASRPYIEMTLGLLHAFGIAAGWTDGHTLRVEPGARTALAEYRIEADWSAASYWYELVALCPDIRAEVHLPRLHCDSLQGDSVVADLFAHLGVVTEWTAGGVILRRTARPGLHAPWHVDFTDCPDLAQTLVVTAALTGCPFHFTGLQSLRIKETDRIAALVGEMARLGIRLESDESSLCFVPRPVVPPAVIAPIHTYQDHRMAMSMAPAAYRYPGLRIAEPDVVSKSYPAFWHDLESIGATQTFV